MSRSRIHMLRVAAASLWAGERRPTSDDYWRQPLKWNAKDTFKKQQEAA